MELKVTEIHHDGKMELTRIFHDVTELKEIATHHGDVYPDFSQRGFDEIADIAYKQADEMIKRSNQ